MKKKLFVIIAALLLCGATKAQTSYTNHWTQVRHEDNMLFLANVKLDGAYLDTDVIEVAAFIGDECRMSAFLEDWGEPHYLIMHGIQNDPNEVGSTVTFKMYNHSTSKEYAYCTYTCTIINGEYFDFDNPEVITFSTATTLPITPYENAEGHDGWHLIASPLAGTDVAPTAVTNMTTGSYDLYYFDQAGTGNDKEWKNYKATAFNLVPGKGYLYANSSNVTLQFIGGLYTGTGEFSLEYVDGESCAHANLSGYNLMGNPFTTEAAVEDGNGTAKAFYRMNEAGSDLVSVASGSAYRMEGIFVVATSATDKVKFVPGSKATRSIDQVNLNLVRNDNKTIDNVIVRFDGGEVLPKYAMHDDSPIIYVPQGGKDYSIVKGSVTSVFPVNFKTSSFGTYTLRADLASAGVSYMHLIDRLTGEDIDMLLEGEYTFIGAPTDNADRFILRLSYSGNFDDNNSIFAYQNGSDIIICGDGTLQVFDVMGRFVSSQEIHGVQAIQALPMGVYIFRMVGEEIQTQKIYVR